MSGKLDEQNEGPAGLSGECEMSIKMPTFESPRSRQVLAALIVAVILAVTGYFGLTVDPDLIEDVAEVTVEETLGPATPAQEPPAEPPAGETPPEAPKGD
jgi:hypothetical protein